MQGFLQLHLLTDYPISNPNRDDLGRPKTAVVGGTTRLRISSQSLKRAWRMSVISDQAGPDHVGKRTRRIGDHAYDKLIAGGMDEKAANKAAAAIAGCFGAVKKGKRNTEQIVHITPAEWLRVDALTQTLASEDRQPKADDLNLLQADHKAADVALFGRMLASSPEFNVEAAAQVSHAFSVQAVSVEDDYFSAVDDLNTREEDAGAGHIGEAQFSAGLMYKYVCVDRGLLCDNLSDDRTLAKKVLRALVESACTVAPSGKQNSFGSRTRALYACLQLGTAQPTSLASAFTTAISSYEAKDPGWEAVATARLRERRDAFATCYGDGPSYREMSIGEGQGSLSELLEFAVKDSVDD